MCVMVSESGKLYTFGANGEGQLGMGGSHPNSPQPQYLEMLEPLEFTMLAAGADHTLVLTGMYMYDHTLVFTGIYDHCGPQ